MKSGIYSILNLVNSKRYIGRAFNLKNRISAHKSTLRNNNHRNDYLQKAWNKHGEENFLFEILEECETKYLHEKEIFYINFYSSLIRDNGYNLQEPTGQSFVQNKESINKTRLYHLGKPKLKSSIEKGKLTKLKYGIVNGSKEQCFINSMNLRKTVYYFDLNGCFIRTFESTNEANKYFNLNNAISSRINRGGKCFLGFFSYSKINTFKILQILMKKENNTIKIYNSFATIEKEFKTKRSCLSSIFRQKLKTYNRIIWHDYEWEIIEKEIETF